MPDDLMHAVLQQKGNHDFGSSNLAQHIALDAMQDGSYDRHVELLVGSYRKKRDAILAAIESFFPRSSGVAWTHPHGGLYVWVTLPEGVDTSRSGPMFKDAVAAGVLYVPGEYCFQPDARGHIPKNHIRLSFGQVDPGQIEPGIERLSRVVMKHLPS